MADSLSKNQYDFSADEASGQSLKPGLYVVATPIGNLRDITLRALDILKAAAVIYCEDTRVTQKLLSFYGIQARLERCDEHKEAAQAKHIVDHIQKKDIVALVSDAGTPGISDPGAKVIAACREAGVNVYPIPGASAGIAALSASGVEGGFLFLGFLPLKSGARRKILLQYKNIDATVVLYEAPQRVADVLTDIEAILGERHVTIAREVTKLHETFYTGTPRELISAIGHKDFKGEVVMLISSGETASLWDDAKIDQELQKLLKKKPLKEAVADVTAQTGLPRKVVYARALALQKHD
jgi:16S rRNA (cytidine1402-2'-O)-methyltransferase